MTLIFIFFIALFAFFIGASIILFFVFAALEKYEKWKWVKNKNEDGK